MIGLVQQLPALAVATMVLEHGQERKANLKYAPRSYSNDQSN